MHALKAALLVATLLMQTAVASGADATFPPGCPENPSMCTYASARMQVGPLLVTIEARAENGSAQLEEAVSIEPSGSGTITIGVAGNASTQGQTFNVTLQVNETDGVAWQGETQASFAYAPTPGFSETREFRFRADDDAAGAIALPILLRVDDEALSTFVTIAVVDESRDADTPFPAVLALGALALSALVVGSRRRQR